MVCTYHGLVKGKRLNGSVDNIDAKVDTPDGKNSFHATASNVSQDGAGTIEDMVPVIGEIDLNDTSDIDEKYSVPSTVLDIVPSKISGSPKPLSSPCYPNFKLGQNSDKMKSREMDTAW